MIVVPAVDLKDGKVVRLNQGRMAAETVYGQDPAEAARRWEAEGALRLHLVDLDAAVGKPPQSEIVAGVIRSVRVPVEVGGGIRSVAVAERYLSAGADRVIFGTAAVGAPDVVREAVDRWPAAAVVAIDAKDGKVAIAGWKDATEVDPLELAERVKAWGVTRVQFTNVARDGTLEGPDLTAIARLARLGGLRVTAAGGIARVEDIICLAALEPLGVDEAVVGKALYDGKLTLAQAHAALSAAGAD